MRWIICIALLSTSAFAGDWKDDRVWHDGLVEKAVYSASRVVYGKPRPYTAIIFTNKEQHDRKTLTKAEKSKNTVEVFKHNLVEDIPTPNYTYHYVTTSHLTVEALELTRLDCSSQEFCGTSFKQYQSAGAGMWDYWSFSYMPEAGRVTAKILSKAVTVVPENALPLWLRDYDFAGRPPIKIALLPDQRSNRATPAQPREALVRHAGTAGDLHKIELVVEGKVQGTYWMAGDRLNVMVKYEGADGQRYELKELSRVDYWTIKE